MPKDRKANTLQDRPDERVQDRDDTPAIVLDVDALDNSTLTMTSGGSADQRHLPEELQGMYYHG